MIDPKSGKIFYPDLPRTETVDPTPPLWSLVNENRQTREALTNAIREMVTAIGPVLAEFSNSIASLNQHNQVLIDERNHQAARIKKLEAMVASQNWLLQQKRDPVPQDLVVGMNKRISCLALEVPQSVWEDIAGQWTKVRQFIEEE